MSDIQKLMQFIKHIYLRMCSLTNSNLCFGRGRGHLSGVYFIGVFDIEVLGTVCSVMPNFCGTELASSSFFSGGAAAGLYSSPST
jgi:hypothetical protein